MKLNKLYNLDCMEGMKEFPDNYFDLAIVDPPYGNYKIKQNSKCKMFDNIEPCKEYWGELIRISKNQIIWGVNHFKNIHLSGGIIIWNKLGIDTTRRKQAPTISEAEIAYQSFNNLIKIFSYAWIGNVTSNKYIINADEFVNRIHPTEKPIILYKWLLKNYANPTDKIIDTHVGSGSSIIAFEDFGCEYIGFELDKDYYEDASKRISQHKAQLKCNFPA